MKKFIKIICVLASIACLTACGEKTVSLLNQNAKLYIADDEWKMTSVKDLTEKLNVLINDDEYISAMSLGMLDTAIDEVKNAKADFTSKIYKYNYAPEVINRVMSFEGVSYDDFSDAAKNVIEKRAISQIPSLVLSRLGTEAVVLYSTFLTMETYAIDKKCGSQIWIIPTDRENVYVMATISSVDELYPLCTVSCSYVLCKDADDLSTITEIMNELGME